MTKCTKCQQEFGYSNLFSCTAGTKMGHERANNFSAIKGLWSQNTAIVLASVQKQSFISGEKRLTDLVFPIMFHEQRQIE